MLKTVHGIIHGKTIEISEDLGVADGQQVEVQVRVVDANEHPGEGIRRSAGGWTNYPELDEVMERIQADRKRERRAQQQT